MSIPSIAVRYARALYETARESDRLPAISEDIKAMETISPKAFRVSGTIVSKHTIPSAVEAEFVKAAFIPYVGKIQRDADQDGRTERQARGDTFHSRGVRELQEGNRISYMCCSRPRTSRMQDSSERRREKDEETDGENVQIETRTVPDLLGGFRITWNHRIIDTSAVERLRRCG